VELKRRLIMSSRQAIPLVGVLTLVVAAVVAGWFIATQPAAPAPVVTPPSVEVEAAPRNVAVAPLPRVVDENDPLRELESVLALARSTPVDPNPRIADAQAQPLLDRFLALRTVFEWMKSSITDGHESDRTPPRDWCRSPVALKTSMTVTRERRRIDPYIKQLSTEEAKYRQRLARASEAWLSSRADLPGLVVGGTDALAPANRRALHAAIKSTNPSIAATAAADLAHLRQTQLEAILHRVIGKDHGDVSEWVTQIMLVEGAAERLEAIDDREWGAAHAHAMWRGELAARFAKNAKDVTPPEVAAWLLAGCYADAKATAPSGADFAFLDPTRNPELAKAVASRPFRRLVQEWSANHAADPAAVAAAAALIKAGEK
jgi:hypothetical protein